jgi:hypothetical protein
MIRAMNRFKTLDIIGVEVLTAALMKNSIFWDIPSHIALKVSQHFGVLVTRFGEGLLLGLFETEDRDDTSFLNVSSLSTDYIELYPSDRTLKD